MLFEKGILFLDIEGTIIKSVDEPEFRCNIIDSDWMKSLISNADEIHCFSWAFCNQSEVHHSQWLINAIEERMDIKFTDFVFRDNMFYTFRRIFGNIDFMEFEELCRALGKETVFQIFIRDIFDRKDNQLFTLVDDMVEDTILTGKFGKIQTVSVYRPIHSS